MQEVKPRLWETLSHAAGPDCSDSTVVEAAAFANQTCSGGAAAAGGGQQQAGDPAKSPHIEVLHEDARIFFYHNFLSDEECAHIISLAEPTLQRSG